MFLTYLLFIILVVIERSLIFAGLDHIRKKGFNNKNILVIGNDDIARRVKKSFKQHPEYGYSFTRNISEELLGDMTKQVLFDQIIDTKVSEVFICCKALDQSFLKSLVDFGDQNTIKIKFVPDLMLENSNATIINYGNFPVIQLSNAIELSFKIVVFKRCFDILFSLVVMISGLPLFVLLMIATKLTSRGACILRAGKNREEQ
jgi:FlaA1/EpsC-like NDP-sugar epimerase